MWRALSLAIGLSLIVLGLQSLFVEQILVKDIQLGVWGSHATGEYPNALFQNANYSPYSNVANQPQAPRYRLFKTRDWMPWSLLAAGAIIVIYTFSLPNRTQVATESKPT